MGLAIDQIRLLCLTERKADLEFDISMKTMEKMAIAREQTELSTQYFNKLSSKDIAYYANGKFNEINYGYLMGYGGNTINMLNYTPDMLKKENSMVLTDANGLVVLGSSYVSTMTKVLGSSCIDGKGRGGTFSTDKIPELIAEISSTAGVNAFTADEIREVMNGGSIKQEGYESDVEQTTTLEKQGTTTTDNNDTLTEMCQKLIDFYYPIFNAAAANGWTTEYNNEMDHNTSYVNDALSSGIFNLAQVGETGNYNPDTNLTYFVMAGFVKEHSDGDKREEIQAWYDKERENIATKEDFIDLLIRNLSTELEAANVEIEALKTNINDSDMKPFEVFT